MLSTLFSLRVSTSHLFYASVKQPGQHTVFRHETYHYRSIQHVRRRLRRISIGNVVAKSTKTRRIELCGIRSCCVQLHFYEELGRNRVCIRSRGYVTAQRNSTSPLAVHRYFHTWNRQCQGTLRGAWRIFMYSNYLLRV